MPRHEREDLERLSRDRERLAKATVDARGAELKADFERQLSATYSFDQEAVWKEAHRMADEVVEQANRSIAGQCNKLGIPPQFAPRLELYWYSRGENASKERRAELRKAVDAEIAALTKNAKLKISLAASEIRVQLLAGSLESDEARQFLKSMPTVADLMPMLSLKEIEQKTQLRGMLQ